MTSKELIDDYILNMYLFSSNQDGWCVYDKVTGRHIVIQKLIKDVERIFPNLDSSKIVTKWWDTNITETNKRVQWFMSDYRLVLGNNPGKGWDVIGHGKKFQIDELIKILPNHHNRNLIRKLFDDWFYDKLVEANTILMEPNVKPFNLEKNKLKKIRKLMN